jgi:hypothetical protein
MNTLSPTLAVQSNIDRHTSAHTPGARRPQNGSAKVTAKVQAFAKKVELVSGDNGNYQIAIIAPHEAFRLLATGQAILPPGYKRQRNIAKLFVIDHHPKFEKPRHTNSSHTTYVQHFIVTPGSSSPRFANGRSIMGIVIQHKPIDAKLKDLYSVRQVG